MSGSSTKFAPTMTPARRSIGLTVADLFSGAGGLSAGFQAAGFEPTFALDKDPDSCATYAANLGLTPECSSIADFTPADLARRLSGVDVILGGPSCQTFSTQGRRFTWADPEDERTGLWKHMLAVVEAVRPRAFLLENVPGLSHRGLAYEKDGDAHGEIADHFRQLGYTLRAAILLAADYGVPQLRRRLFVVGVVEGLQFRFPEPEHLGGWRRDTQQKWEAERVRRGLLRHITFGEAVGDLPVVRGGQPSPRTYARDPESGYEKLMRAGHRGGLTDHEARALGEVHAALVAHVPKGGTWRDIPPHLLPDRFQGGVRRTDSTNLLGRLDPERPSYTITTQFNNVTAGCFTHPTEDRALSVREGARLQSFPDSFAFTGTVSSRCRQVGNAVPPLLAQHLACAVAESLIPAAAPRRPRRIRSARESSAPVPTADSRSRMVRQKRRGTAPEQRVLFELRKLGIRPRQHVQPLPGLRREADGCLKGDKLAIFVDGCFWHGCLEHSRETKSNTLWWREKIAANKRRDADTDATLGEAGWTVVRVWEHQHPQVAAKEIFEVVRRLRAART